MGNQQETGHAKNIANFKVLINHCAALGTRYNPSNIRLTIEQMNALHEQASETLNGTNAAKAAYTLAVDDREAAFKEMMKMLSRIFNALKASGAPKPAVEDAKSVIRKLRAVKKQKAVVADAENPADAMHAHSIAQTSYDNRANIFGELVHLLLHIPAFAPLETEIKTTSLQNRQADLRNQNQNVLTKFQSLNNMRIARNRLLYADEAGIVEVGLSSKSYIKATFAPASPEYKQIASLYFKRKRKGVNYTDKSFTVAP